MARKQRLCDAFTVGQRVILARVLGDKFRGRSGIVAKTIKCRDQLRGTLDEPPVPYTWAQSYDADACNVDAL